MWDVNATLNIHSLRHGLESDVTVTADPKRKNQLMIPHLIINLD